MERKKISSKSSGKKKQTGTKNISSTGTGKKASVQRQGQKKKNRKLDETVSIKKLSTGKKTQKVNTNSKNTDSRGKKMAAAAKKPASPRSAAKKSQSYRTSALASGVSPQKRQVVRRRRKQVKAPKFQVALFLILAVSSVFLIKNAFQAFSANSLPTISSSSVPSETESEIFETVDTSVALTPFIPASTVVQPAAQSESYTEPESTAEETDNVPKNKDYMNKFPELYAERVEFIPKTEGEKVVYLTFDDGPAGKTMELLDLLDNLNVKVTFFVTAQFGNREKIIKALKEIDERGHIVAVHSYSHDYKSIYSSVDAFLEDFEKMDNIILEATGHRSSIFRFPGGSNTGYNKKIRKDLIVEMDRRGYVYHDWSISNGDCDGLTASEQVKAVVSGALAADKSVVLMHDLAKNYNSETIPAIVSQLREEGFRFDFVDGTVKPFQFKN